MLRPTYAQIRRRNARYAYVTTAAVRS